MTLVLVEGASDRRAVLTLAGRLGRATDGVDVVSMQGITNLPRHLAQAPPGRRLLGLYDARESAYVHRVLARARVDPAGFFGCDADLEDELIRALGPDLVVRVLEEEGALASFRTLQKQQAHRDRPVSAQLHRFFSSHSGHKLHYAARLVEAMDLERVPAPLRCLISAW